MKSKFLILSITIITIFVCCNTSPKQIVYNTYYNNGTLRTANEAIVSSNDTLRNGTCRVYFKTGGIESIGNWLKGKENGIFTYYNHNGTIKYKDTFNNGTSIASELKFYDSQGYLFMNATIVNGKKEGKTINYFRNGDTSEIKFFKNDFIDHIELTKDSVGRRLYSGTLQNGTGTRNTYHCNGVLKQIFIYNQGRLMWVALCQDKNGTPMNSGTLVNGNGSRIIYNEVETIDTLYYRNGELN